MHPFCKGVGRLPWLSSTPLPPPFLQLGVADRERKEGRNDRRIEGEKLNLYSVSIKALSANMYTHFSGRRVTLVFSTGMIYTHTHTTNIYLRGVRQLLQFLGSREGRVKRKGVVHSTECDTGQKRIAKWNPVHLTNPVGLVGLKLCLLTTWSGFDFLC